MKKIFLLLFSIPALLWAGNFKPFIQSQFSYSIIDLIEREDGSFLSLEVIPGLGTSTDVPNGYLKPTDVNSLPFTQLVHYNAEGTATFLLSLPNTDSTSYWGSQMLQLSDGRFCIAGEWVNPYTQNHRLFFAITNPSATAFEQIMIDSISGKHVNSFYEKDNGNLAIFDGANYYREYTKAGVEVNSFHLGGIGCGSGNSDYYRHKPSYYVKPYLFAFCKSGASGTTMLRFNENFQTYDFRTLALLPETNYRKIRHFAMRGKQLNDKVLLLTAVADTANINSIYTNVMQIDSAGNMSVFFSDTAETISSFSTVRLSNGVEYTDKNYIYLLVGDDSPKKRSLILYCLKEDGNLRWKKNINLNSELGVSNLYSGYINTVLATQDKGFLFTYSVDNEYGGSDVYYYKVDSTGTYTDLSTAIGQVDNIANHILVYPIPTQNHLIINFDFAETLHLSIFNAVGEKVIDKSISQQTKIDISSQAKGLYFYTIKTTEGKVLKQGKLLKTTLR